MQSLYKIKIIVLIFINNSLDWHNISQLNKTLTALQIYKYIHNFESIDFVELFMYYLLQYGVILIKYLHKKSFSISVHSYYEIQYLKQKTV